MFYVCMDYYPDNVSKFRYCIRSSSEELYKSKATENYYFHRYVSDE